VGNCLDRRFPAANEGLSRAFAAGATRSSGAAEESAGLPVAVGSLRSSTFAAWAIVALAELAVGPLRSSTLAACAIVALAELVVSSVVPARFLVIGASAVVPGAVWIA